MTTFLQFSHTIHNRQTNKKLVKILHALLSHQISTPFRKPVPHKALGLDDYRKIVKKPMDLNQVRRNNNENKYQFVEEVLDDIQLCWNNCMIYNHGSSQMHAQATKMQQIFWTILHQNFGDIYQQLQPAIRLQNRVGRGDITQSQLQNNKKSNQIQQQSQIKDISQKNQSNLQSGRQQKLQQEQQQNNNQSYSNKNNNFPDKQQSNNNMNIQEPLLPIKQPIEVNLNEKPSKQMIEQMNLYIMENKYHEDRNIMEQILEILMTHEKENIITNQQNYNNGNSHCNGHSSSNGGNSKYNQNSSDSELNFNVNKIHLSTYYRICRVLKMDNAEMLEIIQ